MKKTTLAIIVYILGLIFGAKLLGIWDAETSIMKAGSALLWTTTFLIALFYADKNEKK
jgi:hypothetical protein